MCLLEAGLMKLLCSLQSGDISHWQMFTGHIQDKSSSTGTWGDNLGTSQGTWPAFRQLSKHQGISSEPSWAAVFGRQCQLHLQLAQKAEFLQDRTLCFPWQHRDVGPALPIATPGWHITKINPKVGISCFILLPFNKKNTRLWYQVLWVCVYGQRHVTCHLSLECPASPDSLPKFWHLQKKIPTSWGATFPYSHFIHCLQHKSSIFLPLLA